MRPAARRARRAPRRPRGRSRRSPAPRARRAAASTTWRDHRPAVDRRPAACCGSPMRRDWPAASTSAATRAGPRRPGAVARLRPRRDLHQQAADAHAHDVARASPGCPRRSAAAPSRSRSAWASGSSRAGRAPGARRGAPAAGGCRDRPACRNARPAPPAASIAAGSTSLAVGDRRGAGDQHADRRWLCADALGERRRSRGAQRASLISRPPAARDPVRGDRHGLVEHALLDARQPRLDQRDVEAAIGRHARPAARPRPRSRRQRSTTAPRRPRTG